MRIEVVGDGTISQQARTYAEYRVFAALAHSRGTNSVRGVRVLLRALTPGRHGDDTACTVVIARERSASSRVRTTGPHAYAAINRAIYRIRTTARTTPRWSAPLRQAPAEGSRVDTGCGGGDAIVSSSSRSRCA
jgi:hypothetical protein